MGFTHLYEPVFAVIWTTTPWTLPANRAVAVGADIEYALVRIADGLLILARELVDTCLQRYGIEQFEVLSNFTGEKLEGLLLQHPFYDRQSLVISGEHVTLDAGTGLVHTAPAHGVDDFIVGQRYGLEVDNPINDEGKFHSSVTITGGRRRGGASGARRAAGGCTAAGCAARGCASSTAARASASRRARRRRARRARRVRAARPPRAAAPPRDGRRARVPKRLLAARRASVPEPFLRVGPRRARRQCRRRRRRRLR